MFIASENILKKSYSPIQEKPLKYARSCNELSRIDYIRQNVIDKGQT